MKRIILIITSAVISLTVLAQTSSGTWNSRTATYTNTTHKITWQLDDELSWVGRPILTESTLLKVRNDDTHILVKLGASREDGIRGDIWNHTSDFESSQIKDLHRLQAKQNGMTYLGTKATKSQLCGIHAVKTRVDMKKYYPEYDQTVHSIEITYSLYKGNYLYTVSVTALSVLEEEIDLFDRIATQLFNGFSIK